MHLPLTPELEAIIDEAVQSGRYATPLDATREAFALLQQNEAKFQALKAEIQKGFDSPSAGEFNEALVADVKRRGRQRLAAMRKRA